MHRMFLYVHAVPTNEHQDTIIFSFAITLKIFSSTHSSILVADQRTCGGESNYAVDTRYPCFELIEHFWDLFKDIFWRCHRRSTRFQGRSTRFHLCSTRLHQRSTSVCVRFHRRSTRFHRRSIGCYQWQQGQQQHRPQTHTGRTANLANSRQTVGKQSANLANIRRTVGKQSANRRRTWRTVGIPSWIHWHHNQVSNKIYCSTAIVFRIVLAYIVFQVNVFPAKMNEWNLAHVYKSYVSDANRARILRLMQTFVINASGYKTQVSTKVKSNSIPRGLWEDLIPPGASEPLRVERGHLPPGVSFYGNNC